MQAVICGQHSVINYHNIHMHGLASRQIKLIICSWRMSILCPYDGIHCLKQLKCICA